MVGVEIDMVVPDSLETLSLERCRIMEEKLGK